MIQRIQTLFIFLVVVLQSLLTSLPIMKAITGNGAQVVFKPINVMPLAVLSLITSLVAAISIFLYRKRIMQMRVTVFNTLVLLALQGYIAYYIVDFTKAYAAVRYMVPAIFPLVSAILSFLAARNILKDELLIKALDRIR